MSNPFYNSISNSSEIDIDGSVTCQDLILNDETEPNNTGAASGVLFKKAGDDGIWWKPDAAGSATDLTGSDPSAVLGPASAVDSNLCAFDGVTGKLIKDSLVPTSQVILKDGKAGGQYVIGGTGSGDNLTLTGSSGGLGQVIINDPLVINDQAYATPYEASIQSSTSQSWLEILNSGGAGAGAFFGMNTNDFELWSYQGGSTNFYTGVGFGTGTVRMRINNDGRINTFEATDSTTTTSGSFTITGGLGVAKSIFARDYSGVTISRPDPTTDLMLNTTLSGTYTGSENTFISNNNISCPITTGHSNIYIAADPLALTTGVRNLCIGNLSGSTMTSGEDNVNLGDRAGNVNIIGIRSVNVGSSAGLLSTNSFNTNIGALAAFNLTTGTNNTNLGFFSGNGITTGTNNTCIGSQATGGVALTNQTALGYAAICDKSNQTMVGNASVTEIVPNVNATCDLGSTTNTFTNLHLGGGSKFYNGTNANVVTLQAGVTTANKTYTLPITDGTTGQVLSTDGAGTMSWATASGGGGGSTAGFAISTMIAGDQMYSSIGGFQFGQLIGTYTSQPALGIVWGIVWDGVSRWVCINATNNKSYSDNDGVTWTTAATVGGNTLGAFRNGIAHGGGLYGIAADGTNPIVYSTDGNTWQAPTSITQPSAAYGVCTDGAGRWIFSGGTITVSYSTDLANTVNNHGSSLITIGNSCAYGNGNFIVGGNGGDYVYCAAADIATLGSWTTSVISGAGNIYGLAYSTSLSRWVCITSTGQCWYSDDDLVTWTQSYQGGGSNVFRQICWDGQAFLIAAPTIIFSTDGIIWATRTGVSDGVGFGADLNNYSVAPKMHPINQ